MKTNKSNIRIHNSIKSAERTLNPTWNGLTLRAAAAKIPAITTRGPYGCETECRRLLAAALNDAKRGDEMWAGINLLTAMRLGVVTQSEQDQVFSTLGI